MQDKCDTMVPSGSQSTIIPLFTIQYDIVTGLQASKLGVQVLVEARNLSILSNVQTGSGAHPTSFNGYVGAHSPGIKQLGHEAHHSPQVRNEWSYASTPPICLHGT
jgi:hypothetical protein